MIPENKCHSVCSRPLGNAGPACVIGFARTTGPVAAICQPPKTKIGTATLAGKRS
jgi:hypothetical protein